MQRARLHPLPTATKPPRPEPRDDARDAARWRALLNCPGLKVMTETVQPHDAFRKEEGYRYIMLAAASHGIGGLMSRDALRGFVDHLIKQER